MKFDLLGELNAIASAGKPVEAVTPEQRAVADQLFEAGWLNICPPGWRYVVNATGLAALEEEIDTWVDPLHFSPSPTRSPDCSSGNLSSASGLSFTPASASPFIASR